MTTNVQSSYLLLGLTEQQLSVKPTVSSFPTKYNPRTAPLWVAMFDNHKLQVALSRASVEQAWDIVANVFPRYCRTKSITLYPGATNVNPLDKLSSDLQHTRNVLVRFIARSRLFDNFSLRVNSTETSCVITPTTLSISVSARVGKLLNPHLPKYLTQLPYPRLTLSKDRIFYRDLDGHRIRFWVQYLNSLRIFTGYKIVVPWTAAGSIPHAHDASAYEAQAWVEKTLWPSLVAVRRARGARFENF